MRRKYKTLSKCNKELKENFKIYESRNNKPQEQCKVILSSRDFERYEEMIKSTFTMLHAVIGEFRRKKRNQPGITIRIKVDLDQSHTFRLQELFDTYYSKHLVTDDSYLFNPIRAEYHNIAWRWLSEWNIIFYNKLMEGDLEEGETDIDGGALTREFLSEVWKQMGQLKVKSYDSVIVKQGYGEFVIMLFKETPFGYKPVSDKEIISQAQDIAKNLRSDEPTYTIINNLLNQIKAYYRALGLIMQRAIGSGSKIMEKVLPKFFMNVVLRGLTPQDEDYEYENLLNEAGYSDDFIENAKTNGTEKDVRETIYRDKYESYRISIDFLRSGFTLDGYANCISNQLRIIPYEAVKLCFFSKFEITANDVINLLQPDFQLVLRTKYEVACNNFFHIVLPSFSRFRAENGLQSTMESYYGVDFLRNFLAFCTGMHYIPYRQNLKITVEFNHLRREDEMTMTRDSLPVAYTGNYLLKLPGDIYQTQEEFGRKLDQAIVFGRSSFGIS